MRTTLLLLLSLLTSGAFASYRVFELRVTHYDPSGSAVGTETVRSTLDHLQYENYYGYSRTAVQYIDSWYCPGDTSKHVYCDKPPVRDELQSNGPKRLPMNRQPVIP